VGFPLISVSCVIINISSYTIDHNFHLTRFHIIKIKFKPENEILFLPLLLFSFSFTTQTMSSSSAFWAGIQLEAGHDNAPQLFGCFLGALAAAAVLFVFDVLVAQRTKSRWFALHAVANAFVVAFAFTDMLTVLRDPFRAGLGDYSLVPLHFVVAVHAYHMIAFSNLKIDDYVHHLLFAGLISTFAVFDTFGPITNFVSFYVSGLPGGIDYCLLESLTKHGTTSTLSHRKVLEHPPQCLDSLAGSPLQLHHFARHCRRSRCSLAISQRLDTLDLHSRLCPHLSQRDVLYAAGCPFCCTQRREIFVLID
jgi:hypothetical protein